MRGENDTRVRLAHHEVRENVLATLLGASLDAGANLQPGRLDYRTKTTKQKPLHLKDVLDFTERVLTLKDRLNDLLLQMKKRRASR